MFIISIEGQKQLFLNSINDDFIRLLPAQFDTDEKDIEAFFVTEESQRAVRREMRQHPERNYSYDLDKLQLVYFVGEDLKREVAVDLEIKKVLKVTTKHAVNSITGDQVTVQDKIELEP